KQIGGFINKVVILFGQRGDDGFHGLLTHLLGNFIESALVQPVYIRCLGWKRITVCNDVLEFKNKVLIVIGIETAPAACVASRSLWPYLDQEGIPVTIHVGAHHLKKMAALFPLCPKPVFASGKKGNP